MENETINWNEEHKKLESGNWWKPTQGKHNIVFLNEGKDFENEFEGKILQKRRFEVEVGAKPFLWDVTKGSTLNSLYGQIVTIAKNNGKITGEKITLLVKGEGKNTSYTILEALDLNQEIPSEQL
ncbi:MAG: hypothetical protein H8E98_05025 [Bacteroidetes bacterium]|nr:hypothetical protein [Bacteroidota bacterium]